ncbi:MAG: TlyA family RNA methyltransferase [Deltaproteobacteria bacterium]|nr:TlyA family RNA methyltransferase [Deltaproteobacteria bacterium]
MVKERIDILLVQRGLAASRERAAALVLAGKVVCGEHLVEKAGSRVDSSAEIRLKGEDIPFVGRGGLKLDAALQAFQVEVADRVALDIGASTGGFTDCLLQHGVRRVYALDVGYGQLAWSLRNDARVVVMERTNIRNSVRADFEDQLELAVLDLSFVSLTKVLPVVAQLLEPGAPVVALVKPQFEVGKGEVGKGGIVRDAEKREAALAKVCSFAQEHGFSHHQTITSPVLGQKGNVEYLIYLTVKGFPKEI